MPRGIDEWGNLRARMGREVDAGVLLPVADLPQPIAGGLRPAQKLRLN